MHPEFEKNNMTIDKPEIQEKIRASKDFARFLAFYLPQFHPIPENDAWHGTGFSEWRNVVKAKPRFTGHNQPRLPADLGYYDLRLEETREQQAEIAKKYGVSGFVYHHYWFEGKRLLNRPIDEVLKLGRPDFPFCFSWANESWSKKWGPTYGSVAKDPKIGETLIEQRYSQEDYVEHMRWLAEAFSDQRYITVGDRPLFIVYRPSLLPNPLEATQTWKEAASQLGIREPYLCMIESFPDDRHNPNEWGFDASIEFQPDNRRRERISLESGEAQSEFLYDYNRTVDLSLNQESYEYIRYPCIMPSWDNTSRRSSGATIYVNSSPEGYGKWAYQQLKKLGSNITPKQNLIFVNSWNEWAEGSQLEPDEFHGHGYLEEHANAIIRFMKDNES